MNRYLLALGAAPALFLFGLLSLPAPKPATAQDGLPAAATVSAWRIGTLEARLGQCRAFHEAAFTMAWELQATIEAMQTAGCDGQKGTPEPPVVTR